MWWDYLSLLCFVCFRWLLGYPVVYLFGKDHISDAIYHLSTKYLHIFQVFVCRFVFLAIYLSMLYIMKLPLYVNVEIVLNSPEHSLCWNFCSEKQSRKKEITRIMWYPLLDVLCQESKRCDVYACQLFNVQTNWDLELYHWLTTYIGLTKGGNLSFVFLVKQFLTNWVH